MRIRITENTYITYEIASKDILINVGYVRQWYNLTIEKGMEFDVIDNCIIPIDGKKYHIRGFKYEVISNI
jgi:hypothetical protein